MSKGSRTRQGTDIKRYNENFDAVFNKDKYGTKWDSEMHCEICETTYTGRHDRDDCIMALNNKEDR